MSEDRAYTVDKISLTESQEKLLSQIEVSTRQPIRTYQFVWTSSTIQCARRLAKLRLLVERRDTSSRRRGLGVQFMITPDGVAWLRARGRIDACQECGGKVERGAVSAEEFAEVVVQASLPDSDLDKHD